LAIKYFITLFFSIWCYLGIIKAQHSLFKPGHPVNSDTHHEICPVVSYQEDILFFTRVADTECEKTLIIDSVDVSNTLDESQYKSMLVEVYSQLASTHIINPLGSGFNQDIWYSNLIDTKPEGIFHPSYPINDVLPNSICSNFGKGNAYLVINQFHPNGGIEGGFSVSQKNDDSFTFPLPLEIRNFKKAGSEINVTASIDSSVLIIAMSEANNMDLYISFRIHDLVYSAPMSIGADINTPYRESTPMLTHDSKRLFFTSDRPDGFGGKDIYYSERLDSSFTSWSKPVRLNPPVNSPYDDSHPHLMNDNNTVYFSSIRDGSSDIFQAKLLRGRIDKNLLVTIQIVDGNTGEKSAGELFWGDAYQDKRPGYFRSKDGKCRYKFFENKPVVFSASNRNMKSKEVVIDPQELINAGVYDYPLTLVLTNDTINVVAPNSPIIQPQLYEDKITQDYLNRTVLLKNIYFERTKPVVLMESYPSLDRLAEILVSRPKLYINIIGHTDNVGDQVALKKLSEERAKAIKDILLQKGVPAHRVSTTGHGCSQPIAPNDTEENKSKNRRVEIKIVAQ